MAGLSVSAACQVAESLGIEIPVSRRATSATCRGLVEETGRCYPREVSVALKG